MLLNHSELQVGQENGRKTEYRTKQEILTKFVSLTWLVDHYLHSLGVFFHNLLNELLSDFALIDQRLN